MNDSLGVSVVIPYYNSSKTIERCLKSLLTKELRVEVILVDDASTDSCRDIVDHFQKNGLLNLHYYRNEVNLGAGKTRNRGIQEVTMRYLTFLDSDDELSTDFFEVVRNYINCDYDVLSFDACRVYDTEKHTGKHNMKMYFSKSVHAGEILPEEGMVFIRGCTCGKLYKSEMIKNNNILFGDMRVNEDMIFTKSAVSVAKKIYYIEKPLYIYYDNMDSLMNTDCNNKETYELKSFGELKDRVQKKYKKELNSIYYLEVLYALPTALLSKGESCFVIKKLYKELKKNYDKKDKYRIKYDAKYRVSVFLYEIGLFRIYGFLRKLIASLYS